MENVNKKEKFKIIVCIIGIILGITTICIGITTHEFNFSYQGYGDKKMYGGDAYTGIQNATAQTATNVYNLYQTIQMFSKTFLIISGTLIILHYALKLYDIIRKGE